MKAENAWKWMPFWLLFSTVVFAAWRIQLVLGDEHFAAVENYYEAAEDWDAHMEEVRASAALDWSVQFQTAYAAAAGESEVVFLVKDADGNPVQGLSGSLHAFHNAYPRDTFDPVLTESPPGHYATKLPLRRSGVWQWKLKFVRSEEVWIGVMKEIVERERRDAKT